MTKKSKTVKSTETIEAGKEGINLIDPATAALKIAPITVGNPAAAASLAIDQEHLEEYADPDAKSSIVECRRPPKGHFFTVRPEPEKPWKDRAFYFILELEGRDPYIVHPSIAAQKKDEEDTIRPVMLVRYVTMGGEEGLWPVKLNPPDGKSNSWNLFRAQHLVDRRERLGPHVIGEETVSASELEKDPQGDAAEVFGPLLHRAGERRVQ